jgi:DnaJ like chaperone protein
MAKKYAKWIGGGLGWAFGGPIGALLGYALGNLYDKQGDEPYREPGRRPSGSRATHRATRVGDFEVSLLILSAQVIKADGRVDERELSFVREHFKKLFGEAKAAESFKLFKTVVNNQSVSTRQICLQIQQNMDHASRLQLVHFLFGVAQADGHVAEAELDTIQTIANYMRIRPADFQSLKAMFYKSSEADYQVLEVSPKASDDEIKKAYRKMAIKYHPDKVAHLGEEIQAGAKEKFQAVQQAYDRICKERNIK